MKLSEHFTLEEMILSQTAVRNGIDNNPPANLIPALRRTAEGLECIRALTNKPVQITSGFRSAMLNRIVGGNPNSQHLKGEAADIICSGFGTPTLLAILIANNVNQLGIDQLILEFGHWVHVSFCENPRFDILTIRSKAEGYRPGIIP